MSKTVLITGANRGIGLALCRHYKEQKNEVIAVCRKVSKELEELDVKIYPDIDVSSEDALQNLNNQLINTNIDILINNAGILRSESFESLNYKDINDQFQVNTLGPIKVVEALFERLISGSKIIMITSRMGAINDNSSGGYYGYRMSKCALNAAAKSMSVDFKSKGISVALLHPGYVKTEMVNFGGLITPEQSANDLAQRITELTLETTGTFWHSNGEILPW